MGAVIAASGEHLGTLPAIHRSPPHSLSFSPTPAQTQLPLLASISVTELVIFDILSLGCVFALRGPAPAQLGALSPTLDNLLWLPSTDTASPAQLQMVGLWSSEELCLWCLPAPSARRTTATRAEPRLLWRAGPAARPAELSRGGDGSRVAAGLSADGSCLFMVSRWAGGGEGVEGACLVVWDVEDRVLLQSVPLEELGLADRVKQLVVGECKGEQAVSLAPLSLQVREL